MDNVSDYSVRAAMRRAESFPKVRFARVAHVPSVWVHPVEPEGRYGTADKSMPEPIMQRVTVRVTDQYGNDIFPPSPCPLEVGKPLWRIMLPGEIGEVVY